jgi:hypothetical protein
MVIGDISIIKSCLLWKIIPLNKKSSTQNIDPVREKHIHLIIIAILNLNLKSSDDS